jgi:uncharacterized protein YecE (DUF72 family)
LPRPSQPAPVAAEALAPSPSGLHLGTSGWDYPSWKPGFYPEGTPRRGFLQHYAANLTSVEVNYTFRKLHTPEQLAGWLAATPPGFLFSFKAPQRITHFRRLLNHAELLDEFLDAVAPAQAAGKLGALLFQLPPNFKAEHARLQALLEFPRLKSEDFRIAFEFRHTSWFAEETYSLLREHNAALCVADSEKLVTPDIATAEFHYYRLRQPGGYKPAPLKKLAAKLTASAAAGSVFAYVKHEDEPTGALNAQALLQHAAKLVATPAKLVATPAKPAATPAKPAAAPAKHFAAPNALPPIASARARKGPR